MDGSRLATPEEILAWALWWTQVRGLEIFPCEPGGKRPAVRGGFKSATRNRIGILNWYEGRCAGFNLATPTGWPWHDVLDVEGCGKPGGDGWAAFGRLRAAGMLAGTHRLVGTPSHGLHAYFAGSQQRCGSLKAEHIDFKATGGYCLLPPSEVGGRPYVLIEERPPTGRVFDWEAAKYLLRPPRPRPVRAGGYRRGPGSARHLVGWLEGEIQGNRNNGLFWACCRALEAGDEAAVDDLADVALSAGLSRDEVGRTVKSAYRTVGNDQRV
jgi:Bifunctional DNA primase/polymerase, N-terminal